jgi:glycosidase
MHHIDPTLGPDREGDLQKLAAADETEDPSTWIWTEADRCFFELVDDVHSRGMRIIIDGVFNHCGRRFFAFRDLLKRGKTSRYRDWFRGVRWLKDGTFQYKGWFGHKALPEFARSKEDLASPVSDYIFAITKRWMAPDAPGLSGRGVDGWRLDVAFCVPHGFWRRWRKHVKEIDRDAFICGEIVKNARAYLQGDELDAVMNYAWTYPTVAFFCPSANPMPAKELKRQLTRLRRSYPPDVNGVLQNLLDSHDVGRILTFLHNPELPKGGWDDYFGATRASSNKQLKTTRPGPRTQDILRQVVIFQMTYLGAPMIYYGTEAGMWGANDPDNRQPMLWDDIDYEPETHTPTGRCAAAERKPDAARFGFYKRAINLRKTQSALRHGSIQWIRCSNARLLMFERCWRDERLLVALNASDSDVIWSSHISGRDVWTGERVSDKDERTIPPRGWLIIKAE